MGTYKGFTKVQMRKPERSLFDLSHEKKISGRMGKLIPVMISETLPNDTFKCSTEVMLRFAPLLAPIYHRVNVFVHYFFVPTRLLYKDWEKFITNGRLGTETPPTPPYMLMEPMLSAGQNYFAKGSLPDYLGIPPIADADSANWQIPGVGDVVINPLPFAAYYKCWYDYYRDRNYVEDNEYLPIVPYADNEQDVLEEIVKLRTRSWQHDYFTSALPWTQRGDEVLMPLIGTGTVSYLPQSQIWDSGSPYAGNEDALMSGPVDGSQVAINTGSGINPVQIRNIDEVNIENSSVSINDFRQAVALQQWMERNAVAGSRYNESIEAHFARKTSDGRLQRAEYLGGARQPVQISEIMTTAWSEDESANSVPPANMSGRGATYANKNYFRYNCEEHGFVIGIMSVMPTSAYMQGIPRMFTNRWTFLDYPWPSFAHLGEQEVYNNELYMQPGNMPVYTGTEQFDPSTQTLFGYQSRYSDWKWIPSTAHGDFRDTLDFWHLDRKFATPPSLGETFVTFEDALQDRIFAVAEVDTLWCYVYNKCSVVRSLPYFGTPRL